MKISNKQLEIATRAIFNTVSKKIEDYNSRLKPMGFTTTDKEKEQYFKDLIEYNKLEKEIENLSRKSSALANKYSYKTYKGHRFTYAPFSHAEEFEEHLTTKKAGLKELPTKNEIEEYLVLGGEQELSTLIKDIIEKLTE